VAAQTVGSWQAAAEVRLRGWWEAASLFSEPVETLFRTRCVTLNRHLPILTFALPSTGLQPPWSPVLASSPSWADAAPDISSLHGGRQRPCQRQRPYLPGSAARLRSLEQWRLAYIKEWSTHVGCCPASGETEAMAVTSRQGGTVWRAGTRQGHARMGNSSARSSRCSPTSPYTLFSAPRRRGGVPHMQTHPPTEARNTRKHASIHSFIHACIHTCMHTCIHAYIHAYIHTYKHSHMHGNANLRSHSSTKPRVEASTTKHTPRKQAPFIVPKMNEVHAHASAHTPSLLSTAAPKLNNLLTLPGTWSGK
jgi:hypothetical protein